MVGDDLIIFSFTAPGRLFLSRYTDQSADDPKEIFYCGTTGCNLSFVRKDLCDRHRKRHGQQFEEVSTSSTDPNGLSAQTDLDQSPDEDDSGSNSESEGDSPTPASQAEPNQARPVLDPSRKRQSLQDHDASRYQALRDRLPSFSKAKESITQAHDKYQAQQLPSQPENSFSTDISPSNEELQRAVADANEYLAQPAPPNNFPQITRFQGSISVDVLDTTSTSPYNSLGEFPPAFQRHHSVSNAAFRPGNQLFTTNQDSATPHPDLFESNSPTILRHNSTTFGNYGQHGEVVLTNSKLDDQNFGISPSAGTDEFTSWLFDQNGGVYNGTSSGDAPFTNVYQPNVFGQVYSNYLPTSEIEIPFGNTLTQTLTGSQTTEPMPTLDTPFMSTWKRQHLLDIMQQRFTGSGGSSFYDRQIKQHIFEGNVDEDDHALSLASFHRYIDSYWKNFHDQFPILHKPSFLPDFVHDYLVLAVVVMGSSLLGRFEYGAEYADRAAQLANFIAWNLRWQVFTDPESCPPAKLWVLQTLAILEVYEKTNSTRALHERAHVHFAATLTLMRRGSALVGESTPPTSRMVEMAGTSGQLSRRGEESPPLPEKWWSQWIAQEATRRASFGAFLLDAMHAVMFGHAATMVIHEIQLPLPCDDTLWSAPTSSEVGRIEFSLYTNGIKPMTFLNGLKRTLSCRRVRTNPFGRIILMAGLLSVSWHMHQRDLYGKSLDKDNMGVPEGWKAQIVKALEWWKKDYDESLAYMRRSGIDVHKTGFTQEHIQTSESLASVLYHLGHIGVQVDMPDLCILAGAKTLLGRVITVSDRERVHIKMKAWASSSAARHGFLEF